MVSDYKLPVATRKHFKDRILKQKPARIVIFSFETYAPQAAFPHASKGDAARSCPPVASTSAQDGSNLTSTDTN